MSDATVIAESPDYQITFHAADRKYDKLIITFAGQPGQMAQSGFGTGFALRHGFDTVYVAQRHESHFQGLDIDTFHAALRPLINGREVMCYGSSLGAYAALYYGGSIDADILAGAPMLPSWVGFDRPQYRDLPRTHIPLTDVPKSKHTPIILTDPLEPADAQYMKGAIWPAFPHARYVKVPYGGHTVLKTIELAGQLSKTILKVFKTGNAPQIDLPTKGFPPWHVNIGNENMRARNWSEALRHGQAAFDIDQSPAAISLIIRAANADQNFAHIRHFVTEQLTDEQRAKFVDKVPVLKRMSDRATAP